jgi:3-hydroxyisobutyrate dehydrogenase
VRRSYWDLKAWRRLFFAENNGVSKEDMLSIINEGAWQWDYQNKINFYSRGSCRFALKHLVKDLDWLKKGLNNLNRAIV